MTSRAAPTRRKETSFKNVLPETTSRMRRVARRDTGAELVLRQALHARGLRYRLHVRGLPGTPDIVFTKARVIVFVHGCYWHRHAGCSKATSPRNNAATWEAKFDANVQRDSLKAAALTEQGWRVLVAWECEIQRDAAAVADLIHSVLAQELQRFADPDTAP